MTKMIPYAEFKIINLNDLKMITTECYAFLCIMSLWNTYFEFVFRLLRESFDINIEWFQMSGICAHLLLFESDATYTIRSVTKRYIYIYI